MRLKEQAEIIYRFIQLRKEYDKKDFPLTISVKSKFTEPIVLAHLSKMFPFPSYKKGSIPRNGKRVGDIHSGLYAIEVKSSLETGIVSLTPTSVQADSLVWMSLDAFFADRRTHYVDIFVAHTPSKFFYQTSEQERWPWSCTTLDKFKELSQPEKYTFDLHHFLEYEQVQEIKRRAM